MINISDNSLHTFSLSHIVRNFILCFDSVAFEIFNTQKRTKRTLYVQLLPRSLQECRTIAVGPPDLSRGCQSYLLRSQKTGIRNEWKDAITIGGWRIITEQNNNTSSFLAMFQAKKFSSRVYWGVCIRVLQFSYRCTSVFTIFWESFSLLKTPSSTFTSMNLI